MGAALGAATLLMTAVACGGGQAGRHSSAGGPPGFAERSRSAGAATPDRGVLDGIVTDLSSDSDDGIAEIATRFIETWAEMDPGLTRPSPEVVQAANSEVEGLGVAPYDDAVHYQPELRALMLLSGGGNVGTVYDSQGQPVAGALQEYFMPVDGHWVVDPSQQTEVDDKQLTVVNCDIGHLIRTGPGEWASVIDDEATDDFEDVKVSVRDIASYHCPQ